jgi:dehydrogenase/reductase SDR family protein 1
MSLELRICEDPRGRLSASEVAAKVGSLSGKIAIVTGASRGLGKGIALGLGEAGATVYVTGRSTEEAPGLLPGSVGATADEVTQLGGNGVAVRCDHRLDDEVEALFDLVAHEQGRLDILVNNAFASPEQRVLWGGQRFWQIPLSLWDDLIDVGLRSHFVATWHAAPLMIEQGSGLVVNVASHGAGTGKSATSRVILPYSVGKAALHRLSADMSVELRDFGVAVLSIWPPASRTEGMLAQPMFDNVDDWKPTLFTGRVVAAFAAAGDWLARSGEALVVDDLARELGIDDPAA